MLVLSRNEQETIYIGDVAVTVTHIGKHHVKLGIDAPHEVKILRAELRQQNQEEGRD